MRQVERTQRNIILSTVLIVLATLLAGLVGSILLSNFNHERFHDHLIKLVADQTEQLDDIITRHLLDSTRAFDTMDKAAMAEAWRHKDLHNVLQAQLIKIFPQARASGIASIIVDGQDDQIFAAIGEAPAARTDTVPLTEHGDALLYWDDGWWLEHHIELVIDGATVGEWIARIALKDLHTPVIQSQIAIPGSVLAVCARKDGEYPCLSMPPPPAVPAFYISESGLCLASGCEGGAREQAFKQTHGTVAVYKSTDALDVSVIYSVPLADFFQNEDWYERVAIAALLTVAVVGLWVIYLQARPIARSLVQTTIHMQEIMRNLPETVITVSETGVIQSANAATRWMFGYDSNELIGRNVDLLMPELSSEVRDGRFMPALVSRDGEIQRMPHEVSALHKDGTTIPVEVSTSLYRFEDECRFIGIVRDITERKQRELELERQSAQLQDLAANRETVREQERTRIAREIHDELGQSLTTLRMKASLIGITFGPSVAGLTQAVEEMKGLIDKTIQVVRNVATKLRPGALDLGVVSAIEWLAQDFEERSGILCGLDLDPDIELDDERATMVFRVLQESLTNVVRHSGASHVEIAFNRRDGAYWLEVSDDGNGFDMNAPVERKTFGLLGIRERATVLGGSVAISSTPAAGTTLKLRVPI